MRVCLVLVIFYCRIKTSCPSSLNPSSVAEPIAIWAKILLSAPWKRSNKFISHRPLLELRKSQNYPLFPRKADLPHCFPTTLSYELHHQCAFPILLPFIQAKTSFFCWVYTMLYMHTIFSSVCTSKFFFLLYQQLLLFFLVASIFLHG